MATRRLLNTAAAARTNPRQVQRNRPALEYLCGFFYGLPIEQRNEFAKAAKMSVRTIYNYRYGAKSISPEAAVKLSRAAFDVTGKYLVLDWLAPDVDWGWVRATKAPTKEKHRTARIPVGRGVPRA